MNGSGVSENGRVVSNSVGLGMSQFSNEHFESMIESYLISQRDSEFSKRIQKMFLTQKENGNKESKQKEDDINRVVQSEIQFDEKKIVNSGRKIEKKESRIKFSNFYFNKHLLNFKSI